MPMWSYWEGSPTAFSQSVPFPITSQPVLAQDVSEPVKVLADRTQFLSASKSNLVGVNRFSGSNYFSGSTTIGGVDFDISSRNVQFDNSTNVEVSGSWIFSNVSDTFVSGTMFFATNSSVELSGSVTQKKRTVTKIFDSYDFRCNKDVIKGQTAFQYSTEASPIFLCNINSMLATGDVLKSFDIFYYSDTSSVSASFAYINCFSAPYDTMVYDSYSRQNAVTGLLHVTQSNQSLEVDRTAFSYYVALRGGTSSTYTGPIYCIVTFETDNVLEPVG